ncbi:hypothetical protein, partial [Variovorax paradoxus]|uniref:hypothetical protein n=1 Tax=Variovorax paradoxus TaxID=34073 RepID=UPI001ABC6483
RELFLVIGLLSISLAMAGMWPVTPVAGGGFQLCPSGAVGGELFPNDLAPVPVIALPTLRGVGVSFSPLDVFKRQGERE